MPTTEATKQKKPTKKLLGARINPDLLKELKHLSIDLDEPVASLVEQAIADFIEKHKGKVKK